MTELSAWVAALDGGKYTKWAADLTETELHDLLWCIGEFCVRNPDGYIPHYGAHDIWRHRMRTALETIHRIYKREDTSDWKDRMQMAIRGTYEPTLPEIRAELVDVALRWEARFSVMPAITSQVSEYDAAIMLGMSPDDYIIAMKGRTAVARGYDFEYNQRRYQIKANRPSGKKGSKVTLVGKANNFDWDRLVWILYDRHFDVKEAWEWEVEEYKRVIGNLKRVSPHHMRHGRALKAKTWSE
ncbi:MAG: hypothetical protein JNL25_04635 [Rhodospirillaceae bacterium]|nr:hypothetical protein [Rhodospirillaceae bacterium]